MCEWIQLLWIQCLKVRGNNESFSHVLLAKGTPSPGEGRGRGLKPGGGGKPPEEPAFAGFQLKAVPLKFIKELKDIVLSEAESIGSSAVFECEVSPSTAITSWMKDGSNLRESPKHKFTSDGKDRKLAIIDVQLSDRGEYTCVATLGKKEKTSTAKLIVEGNAYTQHSMQGSHLLIFYINPSNMIGIILFRCLQSCRSNLSRHLRRRRPS